MTAHKHAALMAEYAKDALDSETPWEQWEYEANGILYNCQENPMWNTKNEYRRKPRTISINGVEIPEPVREPLNDGAIYYVANPFEDDVIYNVASWDGDSCDKDCLKKGLIFRTKEDAIAASKAIIAALGGEA